ncbi:MAG: TetR/AcrR family transcriptional regulator [Hahellaceae bacterium]|nr:TetR/AcrR family transcriptional regulator [Hahellaceae bacterium]MCP5169179.1 TetR/AcrR family transcriptional regulator [Hahellaceae bacterium]
MNEEGRDAVVIEQRRQPVQERSRERVNAILDQAAEMIREVGVQGAKTSEIARRAGISLPSLYRYFPNKAAIIKALAEQHIAKLDNVLQGFIADFDLNEGFDKLIDAYAEFYRNEPGYKEIWSGVEAMPELQALDLGELYSNARDLSAKASEVFPGFEEQRIWLICVMLPRACGAILRLSMEMEEKQAGILLSELKLMVRAYLIRRIADAQS